MDQRLQSLAPCGAACLPALLLALPHDWWFAPLHVAAVAFALVMAWRAPLVDRQLEAQPGLRWLLMACAAAAVCWLLFGASPRASWGVIDDHEIHAMIGPGRDRIPLDELPTRIATHREIAKPSFTFTRYRPAYYFFRLCEAAVWGRSVDGWMITRLVLFVFTATLGFDLLRQWLGFVGGGIALAVFAALWMWPEIVIQLGPPECYAAPAVVAFAWCAVHIMRATTPPSAASWAGLALAALVAIGAKENFVILAPLAFAVAGCEWWRGRLTTAGILATAVVISAAAWVAFVVAAGIAANSGRDVYQRPVGLAGFSRSGDGFPWRALRKLVGYGLPLLAAVGGLGFAAWRAHYDRPRQARTYAIAAILAMVAVSQFVFYRGEVFKKCRYDLPFVPLVMILLVGAVVAASTWRQGGSSIRRVRRRLLVPGVLAVAACLLGGDHARITTHAYVSRTNTFSDRIASLVAACHAAPEQPVVFTVVTSPAANYEPVISVASYVRSFGGVNPLFLDPSSLHLPSDPATATWQERDLAAAARDGGLGFLPWSQRPKVLPGISVLIGDAHSSADVSAHTFFPP